MTLGRLADARAITLDTRVGDALAALPLERRIGQMMMGSFPGPNLQPDLAEFIDEAGLGGVLLFSGNVQSPWQARELTAALQDAAGAAGLPPMFVAADQEGGVVSRFGYPVTVVPSPMAIAATGDAANASRAAGILAAELRDLGLNLNLSAIADVNTSAANPVIGIRAYGDDPKTVSRFVAAAIAAHHECGVLVAAKHFPGHGDTAVDSHRDLPLLAHDWRRMRSIELPPFAAAVRAGADAILTAHVVYQGIDGSGHPATLSRALLDQLLRRELGFDGLIICDAIEMNAIVRHYGQVAGAVLAARAGADIILTVGHPAEQREIHRALLRAVRDGQLSEQQIAASVARVLRAKLALPQRQTASASSLWPRNDHHLLARQIARESITVVRDDDSLLPLRLPPARRLGLIEFRASRLSPVAEREIPNLLDILVRAHHGNTTALLVDTGFQMAEGEVLPFATSCDALLVATRDAVLDEAQAVLAGKLLGLEKPAVVLALRSPYDLQVLPQARCFVASYGDPPCALEAATGVLFGGSTPSGSLPVRTA